MTTDFKFDEYGAKYSSHNPQLVSISELLARAGEYIVGPHRDSAMSLIEDAYQYALEAHDGQKRLSGEDYIYHPLSVSLLLTELRLDEAAIAAALLHDVVEDSDTSLSVIRERFGPEVGDLVDGVTKLTRLDLTNLEDEQAWTLRKMFLAMARDIRVVLVKLADRMHNIRTVHALNDAKRQAYCAETLEIYAPLCGRLGIWTWKWQLEDGAFRYTKPDSYHEIASMLDARRVERESMVKQVIDELRGDIQKSGLQADLSGRAKHIYSIFRKIQRNKVEFDQIYDLIAIRVIVQTVEQCYQILAMVHSKWRAIPGQFDDYISAAKPNKYQSLHTAVMGPSGSPFEVQIRTEEMHRDSEYGVASHWRYKEGRLGPEAFDEKLAWVRQVLEWQEDLDTAAPLIDILKADVFADQVFVFTPKGDVIDLPRGATPVDFAYRIHTEVGHTCIGAKIGGRLVPLRHELQNGDLVEVLTSKSSKGPSREWLTIVRTGHARDKVRQWFKREQREENEEFGRNLIDRELKRLGHDGLDALPDADLSRVVDRLSFVNSAGLFAAVGYGAVTTAQVINRLGLEAPSHDKQLFGPVSVTDGQIRETSSLIDGEGVSDLYTRVASCCSPLPGDQIIGYITRDRRVTVHRIDCPNIVKTPDSERLVKVVWGARRIVNSLGLPSRIAECCTPLPGTQIAGSLGENEVIVHKQDCSRLDEVTDALVQVSWGREEQASLPVTLIVEAADREGLLRDVATVVAEEGYNIISANVQTNDDSVAEVRVSMEIPSLDELTRLLNRLQSVRSVIATRRERIARAVR
mgnify:CR=1 FL=1|tara:strand:+ start:848 stop:3256 length:2409 start_codon:yes stop_codon:yes gene_type:complete